MILSLCKNLIEDIQILKKNSMSFSDSIESYKPESIAQTIWESFSQSENDSW
jgi:hypothetical protein